MWRSLLLPVGLSPPEDQASVFFPSRPVVRCYQASGKKMSLFAITGHGEQSGGREKRHSKLPGIYREDALLRLSLFERGIPQHAVLGPATVAPISGSPGRRLLIDAYNKHYEKFREVSSRRGR